MIQKHFKFIKITPRESLPGSEVEEFISVVLCTASMGLVLFDVF
jgi:hypothetical protein